MANVRSKIAAQAKIAVPDDVRRKLGVSFEDIHRALFGVRTPKKRSVDELKESIRRYARERYARG
jgi:hypothetical protein